jgi:hypothetical protein
MIKDKTKNCKNFLREFIKDYFYDSLNYDEEDPRWSIEICPHCKTGLTVDKNDCNFIDGLDDCMDFQELTFEQLKKIYKEEIINYAKENDLFLTSDLDNLYCSICGNPYIYIKS